MACSPKLHPHVMIGSPHTLEHLVFLGSKGYKYKGFLDKLATRAFSDTNAWTSTDSTVYTLESAGWDGFATLLPVYLDHVILPTLTDSGCYTEVHHIDGTGQDAGVVYSEMQGTQNTSADLMELKAQRLIYPESVGFRYETGGLLERLRVLSADRIREFHREMYQPKNLCLVLIGEVDHANLLSTLDGFENGILNDVPKLEDPFNRPWVKSGKTPALQRSISETIEFPDEDEVTGEILVNYLGPDCNDDLLTLACSVFLIYICGSSISLLENVLVEKEKLASGVYYETVTRPDTLIKFNVTGIEKDRLEYVEQRFLEILKEAASKSLDMVYMTDCLNRSLLQLRFITENSGKFFCDEIIYDHIYGQRDGSQLREKASLRDFETLAKWSESEWREFFKTWLVDAHHVTVVGRPSKALSERLEKDEQVRVEEQRQKLGEDGLRRLSRALEDAKAANERDIPPELFQRFPVPDTTSVHFIPTTTALAGRARQHDPANNKPQRYVDEDEDESSLYFHFEHIPTNFVSIGVVFSTHEIPEELRPLLLLYLANFFETPAVRLGKYMDHEDVVTQLEKDTIDYGIDMGNNMGNAEVLRISFQVEPEKYLTAIEWIKTMFFDCKFDTARLVANVAKLIATVPEEKRSGSDMADAVSNMVHTTRNSTTRAQNTLVKGKYLTRVWRQLESEPEKVISQLRSIRDIVARPSNLRVGVTADLESAKIQKPVSSWKCLVEAAKEAEAPPRPLDDPRKTLSEAGKKPGGVAYVIPMRSIDSSFAVLTGRGLDSYDDARLPALAVAQSYLDAVEGVLWTAVRGTGMAYGANFGRSISLGLLNFSIYRSPDAHKAFQISKKTVADLAEGRVEIDKLAMEGAMSSIVMGLANEQPTMLSAASVGFANQVIKGIPKDWGTGFLQRVRKVTQEDLKKVLKEMVLPIFEANTANLVLTCASVMEEKTVKGFERDGFKPEVRSLSSFNDDYGFDGASDGGEEFEEDEEDEEETDNEEVEGNEGA